MPRATSPDDPCRPGAPCGAPSALLARHRGRGRAWLPQGHHRRGVAGAGGRPFRWRWLPAGVARQPDFRALVTGALLTGCRYGELAAMKAGDFDPQAGTVHVGRSKSGKARHVVLTDEGCAFFARQAAGKTARAPMFERDVVVWKGGEGARKAGPRRANWGRSHQFRPLREACAAARITPAISFHVLRHTYASRLAMRGAPMPVIAAQLGHADTRMTERHYAHLAPSYVASVVRESFGSLGIGAPADNVTAFQVSRRPAG